MKRWAFLLALLMALNPLTVRAADAQIGYINCDTKVYMDASEKAIVDGSTSLGAQVRIEEEKSAEGTDWYRVTFLANNKEGWVKADDVDLVIAKKAVAASNPPAATPGGVQPVDRETDFPVLTASGAIDPDTLPGSNSASQYRALDVGDSGDDVKALSARLCELGYFENKNSNLMTKAHKSAIRQFQKVNDLTQDGICSAELQARIFSPKAKNRKGKTMGAQDPLVFSKGTVKSSKNNSGTIQFQIKNTTDAKIDAFNITLRLYNTYSERFLLSSISSEATLTDELTVFDVAEERFSIRKNETVQYGINLGYYFAGVMIAVTAYHTENGNTVRIPEDQRHWYGFGKGVAQDYQPLVVTSLTEEEKQLAAKWKSGIDGIYVDEELAKAYNVREGFLIQKMEPDGMIDKAGLKSGDLLLAIGDIRIFGTASIDRALSRLQPGQAVTVLFLRNGVVYQTQMVTPGGSTAA